MRRKIAASVSRVRENEEKNCSKCMKSTGK